MGHAPKQGFVIVDENASASAIEQAWTSGGEKAVTTWLLNQDLKGSHTRRSPITLASDYAELGRREDTLRALENAYGERSPWLTFCRRAAFEFLHGDTRYRALVQRIGLPPAW